jgi:N-acetylglucosamine-6-phosphate deacetylase
MDAAFRNMVRSCGLGVLDAVAAASTRPAELLGLGDVTGRLAAGYAADVVLLDDALRPVSVMRRGEWVPSVS